MKHLLFISIVLSFFLNSCSNNGNNLLTTYNSFDVPAQKAKNPSRVKVKVSLKNQTAYIMEGNEPLMIMPISVGALGSVTPRGNFRIYSKIAKRRAQTHGYFTNGSSYRAGYLRDKPSGWKFIGTPMPYWSEFSSGFGFHTGWLKNRPCTHGCLRMHVNLAPKFFAIVPTGAPVNISYSQPEDVTIGRNVPRPPDASPLPDNPLTLKLSDQIFTKHKTPSFISVN